MPLRFDDIGNRLKAFRLGSGLAAEEIAQQLGISRTALYRFEKGEVAKIETLEKLAELLKVSVPTLLGVGVEYIASAVAYFERMRQIEETAEHIIVLAGPISYVLASDGFDGALGDILRESVPDGIAKRDRALAQIGELMAVLRSRKECYRRRRPAVLNLIAAAEMERFLRNGLVGRLDLDDKTRRARRALARAEAEHFTALMENEPIGVQIGIVRDTLPHTSFQIFRQPDRKILALSPFRLGEEPNIRTGVAMITSAPEALALHETMARELWASALKGPAAVRFMRGYDGETFIVTLRCSAQSAELRRAPGARTASFEARGACHRAGHFGPDPLARALRMTDHMVANRPTPTTNKPAAGRTLRCRLCRRGRHRRRRRHPRPWPIHRRRRFVPIRPLLPRRSAMRRRHAADRPPAPSPNYATVIDAH